jgi:CBS domain containing-hemolysin-like protein
VVRELGRIPREGDAAELADERRGRVRLVVERMRGRRVEALLLERVPEPDPDEDDALAVDDPAQAPGATAQAAR